MNQTLTDLTSIDHSPIYRPRGTVVFFRGTHHPWETIMRVALILTAFLTSTALADDSRYQLKITTHRGLPGIEKVTAYRNKSGKRERVGEQTKLDERLALPDTGPFEVWVKPKAGIAVKAADTLRLKAGKLSELKLGDLLGAVEVFGDNFPRAEKIVLTDTRDPGPGEKGHVAIQEAKDYRMEMLVPSGRYAVWVVPANGAKAQRVEDDVRVLAGRTVKVGG